MERERLIASIVVLFVYLLALYPLQTIVSAVIILAAYFFLRKQGFKATENNSRASRRRAALKAAQIYLAPYSGIWGGLRLSNTQCTIRLATNGVTITASELKQPYRKFEILRSNVHDVSDLWDMFCLSFDHQTTFDTLVKQCDTFKADICIYDGKYTAVRDTSNTSSAGAKLETRVIQLDVNSKEEQKEKLDINNASEIEITALPGVSVVLAKRLVKKREEIRGFKSVDDVCIFLHLRPHMEKQLRELICVNKMNGSIAVTRNKERKIDL